MCANWVLHKCESEFFIGLKKSDSSDDKSSLKKLNDEKND